MRRLLLALVLIGPTMWSGPVLARDFEKGIEAYDRGDYVEAAKWYRLAAEQGNKVAQNNLGVLYAEGNGVPQDYTEAAKWYRLAAEQGYSRAQYKLGASYDAGYGVPQDYILAHMWYNIAASFGHEQSALSRKDVSALMTKDQIAEAQRLARECVARSYKGC